jgi:vancomycin permeability regulator SanA
MNAAKALTKRVLLTLIAVISAGILMVVGLNLYEIIYSEQYTITTEDASQLKDVDCIMVLGCGVWGDAPSPLLADRLKRGVEVFHAGASPKILMSGDHGQIDYDEVNVMKQYALDAGISEADIFMDHAGFSTYESMYRAKEIFGVKKMIIVTQKYHLSRAVFIANKLGIESYGVASDYQTFSGQFGRDCREVLARVKDAFTVMLKPKPTYLGESIPISGDGTITNG